jgi:hypothetical protein
MVDLAEIRWIKTGVVAGLCASLFYPVLLFAPLPLVATAAFGALLGPAIGIGSLGLRQLIRLHGESVAATLGAIHNTLSDSPGSGELVGIWLGLDVAWDTYIGLGTIFFAWAMLGHPRFRWPFAVPGFALGLLVIVLNLHTFPSPPAEAGSVDVGPFVGLWYLAATVQAWRSLGWAREKIRQSMGA